MNAFKYKRIHKIKNGNTIKSILIGFLKKENLRLINNKSSETYNRIHIANENKINLTFGFKLNLVSNKSYKEKKN